MEYFCVIPTSHWRIFLCHSRLISHWIIFPCHSIGEYFCVIHVSYDGGQLPPTDTLTKALAPIRSPHPHFIFTRVQPTIWMYESQPVCACIKVYFQTWQKWKFSVSGAQTGAVSAMLKVTSMLVIARLFTRLRFSTSLLVIARLFISFRFSCHRGPWCQELFKNYISLRAC